MRESAVKSAERMENIAQNIRLMMCAQRVSVTDMAERLDLTRQTLGDRLGKHPERLQLGEIANIARVLNTTLDRLICGEYRLMREDTKHER